MTSSSESPRSRSELLYAPAGGDRSPQPVPFVVGIIGDFAAHKSLKLPVEERKFFDVTAEGLDNVIEQIAPRLNLTLPSGLDPRGTDVVIRHSFHSLDDFRPVSIIKSNEVLQALAGESEAAAMEDQVRRVVRHREFLALEGNWRGVDHVLSRIPSGLPCHVRLLDLSFRELAEHESSADSWDATILFEEMFDRGLGQTDTSPMGCLIAAYEFDNHPDAMRVLEMLATIGAICQCPVLAGAAPDLVGVERFEDIPEVKGLARKFEGPAYIKWRGLRESDDSRYLALSLPRLMARPPCEPIQIRGQDSVITIDSGADQQGLPTEAYCWMNGAFGLAGWMIDLFQRDGGWGAIGESTDEGIPGLVSHRLLPHAAGTEVRGPLELEIGDETLRSLADLGFLAWKQRGEPPVVSLPAAVTAHHAPSFHDQATTRRAKIAASLPFVMVTSSFVRVLMRMARDRLYLAGQSIEATAEALNAWLGGYVGAESAKPLIAGKCEVKRVERTHDDFELALELQPRLHGESPDEPVRLGAEVPRPG